MLEYSSRPMTTSEAPTEPEQATLSTTRQEPSTVAPPAAATARKPETSLGQRLTFKCERNGRTSFSDKPCTANEQTLAVTREAHGAPSVPHETDLARMRRQLAQMEAERIQREQQFEQEMAARRQPVSESLAKANSCSLIDEEVSRIDSILRQPHSAQWGDYWTERRKKLMDERFDLHC